MKIQFIAQVKYKAKRMAETTKLQINKRSEPKMLANNFPPLPRAENYSQTTPVLTVKVIKKPHKLLHSTRFNLLSIFSLRTTG
jgi:hypothetical protein